MALQSEQVAAVQYACFPWSGCVALRLGNCLVAASCICDCSQPVPKGNRGPAVYIVSHVCSFVHDLWAMGCGIFMQALAPSPALHCWSDHVPGNLALSYLHCSFISSGSIRYQSFLTGLCRVVICGLLLCQLHKCLRSKPIGLTFEAHCLNLQLSP